MKATLAGGCFWCTEAIFQHLPGVQSIQPGYMGGTTAHPTYEEVCTGNTGHAEVIQLEYDENQLDFNEILSVFFKTHDPTTLNRQGNDIGTQYRSEIFYHNDAQKDKAEKIIQQLTDEEVFDRPIVTQISPASDFYPAEDYHENYFKRNPNQPYCAMVIQPKVQKFLKTYSR